MSTPSFRYPVAIEGKAEPEIVEMLQYHDDAITDLQQSIPSLKSQITSNTASTTSTTENVTETNQQTTGSSVGGVNNQAGVTSYATAQSDYGAFILLSDASAIAVTLTAAPVIALPWYATLINSGTGTATLTPASGTINGAGSFALLGGQCVTVVFDGTNFEIVPLLALPVNTAGVSHEWIASYNASTGVFTLSQPAFTDISGVATTAQIGTGTPSAGEYVDGGTGAWTALPTPPSVPSFVDNETVSGSGTSWILANTPAAGCVPQLFVELAGFGLIGLLLGSAAAYGYTISGASITTVSSYSGGALHAWYRD